MADFRRWFFAFAMVALLAGLTIPANAQSSAVTCNTNVVPTTVRAEAYADFVGDYVFSCSGGAPTTPGSIVPQINITVFLTTNITSKLTAGGLFNEALLIIDEPNTPGANSGRPILNCGATAAPDSGPSGPGVCAITAPAAIAGVPNPAGTYDPGVANTCAVAGTYGCGRPNIFQGRLGVAQNTGQNNIVVFAGVPFDPPGTLTTRTVRITNIRADAEFTGVSSTFTQSQIQMNVSISGTTFVTINNSQQIVALVQRGLISVNSGANAFVSNLGFLQCNTENGPLFNGTSSGVIGTIKNGAGLGGFGGLAFTGSNTPIVRFQEGFNTAWKTKNISFLQTTNGTSTAGNGSLSTGGYVYAGTVNYPPDNAQNVPGANYNTESGFEWNSSTPVPAPTNPPNSTSSQTVQSQGVPLSSATTGISNAGSANQGTRLALSFSNVPTGSSIFVAPVLFLYRQSATSSTCSPSFPGSACATVAGGVSGVMVLTTTDANGAGAFSPPTLASTPTSTAVVQVSNNLAVYEVLFSDPNSLEQVDIPVVVAYVSNLTANPPVGLPVTGQISQVAGGFAPFYTTSAARQPSSTLPVPRFIPGNTPLNLFSVVKCACDILFPFVASVGGFDTGIAISNTSLDPGATFGFGATPQQGAVQFWFYGVGANGGAPPASVTSNIVPAGQVLTYVLSNGGGSIGTNPNFPSSAAVPGFTGYVIAQAGFQWCHGFAFIQPVGGGPTASGVSEGYLGIIIDGGAALNRTSQAAEIKAH